MTAHSTNVESLGLQGVGPDVWSTKITPTLLDLPLEIRTSIYGYLYEIETAADLSESTQTTELDLTPLYICHQIRDEVIEHLLKNYSWTRLAVFHDQISIPYVIKQLTHLPMHLFTASERARVMSGSTLHIQIGDSTPRIAGRPRDDILVCHTAGSHFVVPEILIAPEGARSPLAIVTIPKESMNRKRSAIEDLVLALARVRGRSDLCRVAVEGAAHRVLENAFDNAINNDNASFEDYHEHALAMLEEAHMSFGARRYKAAALDYMDGLKICEEFLHEYTSFQERPPAEQVNPIRSLKVDLANGYGMASYVALALLCQETGALLPEDIHQISTMINTCYASFEWCAISDRQRVEAHYRYGVALQLLGEYLMTPSHREYILASEEADLIILTDRSPADLFEDATSQFFYAWQVDVESPVAGICEGRYVDLSYKTGFYMQEDPQLVAVDGIEWYEDGKWTGDPALVAQWTIEEMLSADSPLEVSQCQGRTEGELRQMKKDLCMPGEQCDGLVRLLGLGKKASDKAICSSWW